MPGTIAMIDRTPFNQLKVGDIIVFTPQIALETSCNDSPSSSLTSETPIPCYIIHRIVSITTNSQGKTIVTTKGDNNAASLQGYDTSIDSSMYIGQVVLQFPLIGYATVQPYNEYLAVIIMIILITQLFLDRRMSRKERAQAGMTQESGTPDTESESPPPSRWNFSEYRIIRFIFPDFDLRALASGYDVWVHTIAGNSCAHGIQQDSLMLFKSCR